MASEYRAEVQELINETPFEPDSYHLVYLLELGVKLGLEAAAAAVEDTEVVTYTFAGVLHEDGDKTLGNARRAILSLSPTDILKAKGK